MAKIIGLDGDGVLLDYHEAYRRHWASHFGCPLPAVVDPSAYWVLDRFDIRKLHGDELAEFRSSMGADFWRNVPALPGAVSACNRLVSAGYELVCISALAARNAPYRLDNLRNLGFPISDVIPTPAEESPVSPKAAAIHKIMPVAFVDDFLPYFNDVPSTVHRALIDRETGGSPNFTADRDLVHSIHDDLPSFVDFWLS